MSIVEALIAYLKQSELSRWVIWPLVAPLLALIVLAVEREILFQENLFDVQNNYDHIECPPRSLTARTADGTCNDLEVPQMGAKGVVFGRNIDPDTLPKYVSDEEILDPNPRKISLAVMGRDEFKPVEQLNFIAAAWVQFMVHDWFDHGENDRRNPIKVPIEKNDPFFKGSYLRVDRTGNLSHACVVA